MNKLDKIIFRTGGLVLIGLPILYIIWWWVLPVTINRHTDIKFAEQIIEKIESYKRDSGLPESDSWDTLRQFGFHEEPLGLEPTYEKINDSTFEIVYYEGFDSPYLMWNSKERKWKMDVPSLPDDWKKKKGLE
jgi:hypothetical protein